MLYPKNIPAKTYQEQFQENLGKIPVYSGEWTNYNPADPGITVLENLTALQIIQQNRIDKVPREVRVRLLELVGYRQQGEKSAEVWLEAAGVSKDFDIPAGQRFMAGDISFETTREIHLSAGHITAVLSKTAGVTTDISHILNRDVMLCAKVFGDSAPEGAALWLVMDEPPQEGEEKVLYVTVGGREDRTPFSDEAALSFAEICWECLTEEGFIPMQAEDGTHGFLTDGYLRLTQPKGHSAVRVEEDGISGYVWRARLVRSEYDAPPVLRYLSGFLFPVTQKETKAVTHSFGSASQIVMHDVMPENGYRKVYVKEQKGSSYTVYEESTGEDDRGRYYRRERLAPGKYAVVFDRKRFGRAPGRFRDAVKIVTYSEEMMRNYYLGKILGYDGQEIVLPGKHVLMSDFLLIAGRTMQDGETFYDFLKPGRQDRQEMHYSLQASEGKLVIHDPGKYIGAKLYLGAIAVMLGPEGNVRSGNVFLPAQFACDGEICFRNPAPGRGGTFQESFEEMRRRFTGDLDRAETAVTPSDYETLVRRLPGLCISKVRAWMDYEKNEVQIAVLPGNGDAFPQLSEKYRFEIERQLDDRRLLSTGIRVRQPVYTAVFVSGTIFVKPHYEDCRKQIESALQACLDYVRGSMGFGERLRFERIFRVIEELDCVSYVQELFISPQNTADVTMDGTDIVPAPNCLLYPGDCNLHILPQTGKGREGRASE